MKKILAVLVVMVLATSCSKGTKLERTLRSNLKTEFKKDKLDYQINELTIIKLDTIPMKANESYQNAIYKVINYKTLYEDKQEYMRIAQKWGSYSGLDYEVLKKEADSLLNLVNVYEQEANHALKHNRYECFLTFIDYVIIIGNLPVRTQVEIVFKYDEKNGKFKKLYKSTHLNDISDNITHILCNEDIPDPIKEYRK